VSAPTADVHEIIVPKLSKAGKTEAQWQEFVKTHYTTCCGDLWGVSQQQYAVLLTASAQFFENALFFPAACRRIVALAGKQMNCRNENDNPIEKLAKIPLIGTLFKQKDATKIEITRDAGGVTLSWEDEVIKCLKITTEREYGYDNEHNTSDGKWTVFTPHILRIVFHQRADAGLLRAKMLAAGVAPTFAKLIQHENALEVQQSFGVVTAIKLLGQARPSMENHILQFVRQNSKYVL
jgi:hypothetical protein